MAKEAACGSLPRGSRPPPGGEVCPGRAFCTGECNLQSLHSKLEALELRSYTLCCH